jgi:hypothetical protein
MRVTNDKSRPLYPRVRPDTHCTGGWVGPDRDGLIRKIHPTGIRSLGRPARSKSLHGLHYPGLSWQLIIIIIIIMLKTTKCILVNCRKVVVACFKMRSLYCGDTIISNTTFEIASTPSGLRIKTLRNTKKRYFSYRHEVRKSNTGTRLRSYSERAKDRKTPAELRTLAPEDTKQYHRIWQVLRLTEEVLRVWHSPEI